MRNVQSRPSVSDQSTEGLLQSRRQQMEAGGTALVLLMPKYFRTEVRFFEPMLARLVDRSVALSK